MFSHNAKKLQHKQILIPESPFWWGIVTCLRSQRTDADHNKQQHLPSVSSLRPCVKSCSGPGSHSPDKSVHPQSLYPVSMWCCGMVSIHRTAESGLPVWCADRVAKCQTRHHHPHWPRPCHLPPYMHPTHSSRARPENYNNACSFIYSLIWHIIKWLNIYIYISCFCN